MSPSAKTYSNSSWTPSAGSSQGPPGGPLDLKQVSETYSWQQNNEVLAGPSKHENDTLDLDILGSYQRDPNTVLKNSGSLSQKWTSRYGHDDTRLPTSESSESDKMPKGGRFNVTQNSSQFSNGQNNNLPF